MKRIFIFITLAVFIVFSHTAAAAAPTVEDKIAYLISQGIPEDFLKDKDASAISNIYDMLYGENVQFLGTETAKLSETLPSLGVSPLDTIPESDMLLKISQFQTVSFDNNNRQVIKSVMVYIEYEWSNVKPLICKKDGITVNWESGLFAFKQDSFRSTDYKKFLYKYNKYGSYQLSDWIESDSQINPADLNQGGLGYFAYLNLGNPPMGQDITLRGAKGWASMSLLPRYKIYAEDGKWTVINVNYVHNKNPFKTIGFSWSGVGVTVDLSSGSQDSVAKAVNIKYST